MLFYTSLPVLELPMHLQRFEAGGCTRGGCTSSPPPPPPPHATTRHKEGCHGDSVLFTLPQHIKFTPLNGPLPQPRAYLQEAGLEARKQFPTPGQ